MPPGPEGDDDELADDISVELVDDGPPPIPGRPAPEGAETELGEMPELAPELLQEAEDTEPNRAGEPQPDAGAEVETRPPLAEAAEADPAADLALYEAEAAAAEGGRRAVLLLEVVRLREAAGAAPDAILEAARAAFAADPTLPAALGPLRRLLTRTERWAELAEAVDRAARARPVAVDPAGRADLLVEHGRILEDRLSREADAQASYDEALAVAPDHPSALLSLLLGGARRQDGALTGRALAGLSRRADSPARRVALVIEAARAERRTAPAEGAAAALGAIDGELERTDPADPAAAVGTLLGELDSLTRGNVPAAVGLAALEDLGRRVAATDPALAVALTRERARALRRQAAPEAALDALDEAAKLAPAHPLVAAERLELAHELERPDAADEIARAFIDAAVTDDEAVDFAIAYAEATIRAGRSEAATLILQASRVRAHRGARPDLRAIDLVIAAGRRDAAALADAFAAEAELGADEASRIAARSAAGAVRAWALGETEAAEDLFQRALGAKPEGSPPRPALEASVALLLAGGRIDDAAAMLERALQRTGGAAADAGGWQAFETSARELLVALYADELGQPGRALPHQRRLVELGPGSIAARARLADLDLQGSAGAELDPVERAANWMALAAGAGEAAASALSVEAGRTLVASGDAAAEVRGLAILRELAPADRTGLAAAALERAAPTADARAEIVARELESAADAPADRIRALRFRLAHHPASEGRYAEALAALTPLRSEGDPLARGWSYELARRSGDAILEVAVLSEEIRAQDGVLGAAAGVWLAHAEALERLGDPRGAADSFRQALAAAPGGETAADAALGLYRTAAADARVGPQALPEALAALGRAVAGEPELAAAVEREAALARAAAGTVVAGDLEAAAPADAPEGRRAEATLLRFLAGARGGDARAVAESLLDVGKALAASRPAEAAAVLSRAAARARLAGAEVADAVAGRAVQTARTPALAPALSDLPPGADGAWPEGRPDPRRARARRTGGATGLALDLEVALDAERRGALGAALAAYGNVIAVDPHRLEAWSGIRRVARAGGDGLGEARALARLGALVLDPAEAVRLLMEAGTAYERVGRVDDAIAVLSRAVEIEPDRAVAFARVRALLGADLDAPGRAEALDGLLSYRLAAGEVGPGERIALLFERAEHRLGRLDARPEAFRDLKQILRIDPQHKASLLKLGYGAIAAGNPRDAVHWLGRYLAAAGPDDADRAAEARLELGACFEAAGDPGHAVEALREAAALRPGDPKPLERLSEVYLRRRDARNTVETLRMAEARLPDPRAQAAVELRVGEILRDLGRDPAAAAAAFRRASELDPLGAGTAALIALHDAARDTRGVLEVIEREIAELRRALAGDPLDARRLGRLAEYLAAARARGGAGPTTAAISDAEAAVESVRRLVENRGAATPGPARPLGPKAGRAFVTELGDPAAGGFLAEIWPHLREVAGEMFPAKATRARRPAVAPGSEPRLGWIEATARGLGFSKLAVIVSAEPGAPAAIALEDPEPALVLGAGALAAPAARFHVGRALGLLALGATIVERTTAPELASLFASAALLAGVALPAGLGKPSDAFAKQVARAIRGKDKKALALQASRFGFEAIDMAAWREALLRAADRFGLLLAGDPALAAVARAGGAAAVARSEPALDILRFALGDRYPAAKQAAEGSR